MRKSAEQQAEALKRVEADTNWKLKALSRYMGLGTGGLDGGLTTVATNEVLQGIGQLGAQIAQQVCGAGLA